MVIAESFERIHRSNLIGMGILPLEFLPGQNADNLGLTGKEKFSINLKDGKIKVHDKVDVIVNSNKKFTTICRLDTDVEVNYFN